MLYTHLKKEEERPEKKAEGTMAQAQEHTLRDL